MTEIKLTETQNDFVSKVENDAFNPNKHIFILKGYAGTGKTVTSSYVAKSDNFKNILIAAPTVMANSPVDQYGEPFFTNGEELIITKVFDKKTAKSFFNDEIYDDIRTGPFAIKDTDLDLIKTGLDLDLIDYVEVEDSAGFTKTAFISTDIEKPIEGEFKILFEIINDIAKLVNGVNPMIRVDFGYARTIHKAQGSEWNDVFGWITSKNIWGLKQRDPDNWQSLPYTMYTRGKTRVRFVYANT